MHRLLCIDAGAVCSYSRIADGRDKSRPYSTVLFACTLHSQTLSSIPA
ncbi:MAG: hypothetical protein IKI28_07010 [Bacteroidales bacterium]|nr:hypothetical protein [Bacteroidales bacterium]